MLRRRHSRFVLIFVLSLFALLLPSFLPAQAAAAAGRQNHYPIVLVHGFAGFGRDELLGFKYWGGLIDLQEDLRAHGYETYTAAVGPFSSNWDRAVELYTQIVGGRVDYGAAHAAEHGHERFGRTYPGLYPQWGQIDPATGQPFKIHLIGHSMGGQTIRLLAQLLAEGSAEERAATPPDQLSPLFNGERKPWIASITTISTPHDGTTLATGVDTFLPAAQEMIAFIAAVAGAANCELYDFKLDQWGLKRQPGESFSSYADRVWNSRIWHDTKDISAWDLSPEGARELNGWVKAQPDIYYFSVATEKTYRSWLTGHQIPELTMNPFWMPSSFFMGAYTHSADGMVTIDSGWWQNDGIVNTISMNGPKINSTDQIVPYTGTPQIGKWNYLGLKESYDHTDIIGLTIYYDVRNWYRSLADMLGALPK